MAEAERIIKDSEKKFKRDEQRSEGSNGKATERR
jgi:hypothetical protein